MCYDIRRSGNQHPLFLRPLLKWDPTLVADNGVVGSENSNIRCPIHGNRRGTAQVSRLCNYLKHELYSIRNKRWGGDSEKRRRRRNLLEIVKCWAYGQGYGRGLCDVDSDGDDGETFADWAILFMYRCLWMKEDELWIVPWIYCSFFSRDSLHSNISLLDMYRIAQDPRGHSALRSFAHFKIFRVAREDPTPGRYKFRP